MLQRRACVMQSSCLCVSIHFPYFITRERQNSWLPSPRTEIAKSLKLPLWLKWILIPPSGDKWAETPWVFGVTGWRSGSSLNSLRGTTCPPPPLGNIPCQLQPSVCLSVCGESFFRYKSHEQNAQVTLPQYNYYFLRVLNFTYIFETLPWAEYTTAYYLTLKVSVSWQFTHREHMYVRQKTLSPTIHEDGYLLGCCTVRVLNYVSEYITASITRASQKTTIFIRNWSHYSWRCPPVRSNGRPCLKVTGASPPFPTPILLQFLVAHWQKLSISRIRSSHVDEYESGRLRSIRLDGACKPKVV